MTKNVLIISGFPNPPGPKTSLMKVFGDRKYRVTIIRVWEETAIKPDIIVGISVGGLTAVKLAALYPKAKLILIGTGPYLKTAIPIYNLVINLEARDDKIRLVKAARMVPSPVFKIAYKLFNLSQNIDSGEYNRRASETWEGFVKTGDEEIVKLLKLATTTNNLAVLKKLQNNTLIICGNKDNFMPPALSEELHRRIAGSRLVMTDGLHYDGMSENEFDLINKFLSN